ncbi:MAG: Methyl-accepting chemotaxis protein II [Holosporales bacterium]
MLVDDASKTSQHANEMGMIGTQELEETQSAISKIERSTKRILKITQILDELSFQTNLLALNASIEAARIGHLGDGFNVVANEVRELSKKSAEASQNIQELLRENYEHVN